MTKETGQRKNLLKDSVIPILLCNSHLPKFISLLQDQRVKIKLMPRFMLFVPVLLAASQKHGDPQLPSFMLSVDFLVLGLYSVSL